MYIESLTGGCLGLFSLGATLNNKLGKKAYRPQLLLIPALINPGALSIAARTGIA
jgi:hypothetical protein